MFPEYDSRHIQARDVVDLGLPRNPLVFRGYLRGLVDQKRSPEAATVWSALLSHHYADDKLANEYISFLLQNSRPEAAAQAWAQYASQRERTTPIAIASSTAISSPSRPAPHSTGRSSKRPEQISISILPAPTRVPAH